MSGRGGLRVLSSRYLRGTVFVLFCIVPFALLGPLDWATGARWTDPLTVVVGVAALTLPFAARRLGLITPSAARALVVVAVIVGVFVATTGVLNGQTFEGVTTPRYAAVFLSGENPYSTPLVFHFTECAGPAAGGLVVCSAHLSDTYYVYLPLLTFAQIPGVPYSATALLAWAALVYLVRNRTWALVALGNPWVALLAANGYNDFPPLLLLTAGIVLTTPWARTLARALSLGMKQFANVAWLGYYLLRREYRSAALAVGVSVGFLLPFLLWAPRSVACTVLLHETGNCTTGAGSDLLSHLNYWLWPLWLVALYPGLVERAVRRVTRSGSGAGADGNGRSDPAFEGSPRMPPELPGRAS